MHLPTSLHVVIAQNNIIGIDLLPVLVSCHINIFSFICACF
jgi:hypothetical protein